MSAPKSNLEALPRSIQFVLLLGFVALAAFPFVGSEFYQQMVARMMILAIFAMSLDLLQGVTGLVSLGHAAFFGLGGYALALMSSDNGPVSLWWTLPAAVAVAGLFALVIGFFVVRTRGIYFIMVTMAFAQMLFFLVFDNKELNFLGLLPLRLGGSDGVYINFKPDAALFDLENKKVFYYFVLACLVLVYVFLRRLLWSPFGRALAGLAGYLWGAQTGFVNPELMGFHMSAHAIMMVILGGMGNFAGAIVGAFAFEFMLELSKDLPTVGGFRLGKHWQLWMGLFIVAVIIFAPRGLLGLMERFGRKGADHE